MILINVKSDEWKLKVAADMVPRFFENLQLEDLPSDFVHTTHTPGMVYARIKNTLIIYPAELVVIIKTYRPWNPWTKAIAYAKDKTIFVNERKIPSLDVADYVGNFSHEIMHLLGYSHKGNYVTEYNLQTVPYVIGSLAEAWARGKV